MSATALTEPDGLVERSWWQSPSGDIHVAAFEASPEFANAPTGTDTLTSLQVNGWDTPWFNHLGDDYGQRVTGYLVPDETGPHRFWLAADENASFRLSPDASRANLVEIASTPGPISGWSYDTYASQKSVLVDLVAGESYFFEMVHREDWGQDHASVQWRQPSEGDHPNPAGFLTAAVLSSRPVGEAGPTDSDRDGIPDAEEILLGLNPQAADSDDDRLPDGFEVSFWDGIAGTPFDPYTIGQPGADTDQDGLADHEESRRHTDPTDRDTDQDGVPDGSDSAPRARNYTSLNGQHYEFEGYSVASFSARASGDGPNVFAMQASMQRGASITVNGVKLDYDPRDGFYSRGFSELMEVGGTLNVSAGGTSPWWRVNVHARDTYWMGSNYDHRYQGSYRSPRNYYQVSESYLSRGRSTDTGLLTNFDVDIDSDNDNGLELPSRSESEGAIESVSRKTLPWNAQGFGDAVPIVLELSANTAQIPYHEILLSVDYDQSLFTLFRDKSLESPIASGSHSAGSLGVEPGAVVVVYARANALAGFGGDARPGGFGGTGGFGLGRTYESKLSVTAIFIERGFNRDYYQWLNDEFGRSYPHNFEESFSITDRVAIRVERGLAIFDLDVDTNGDGRITDEDDAAEDRHSGTGQIVFVNSNDDDRDLIPDHLDGFGAFARKQHPTTNPRINFKSSGSA